MYFTQDIKIELGKKSTAIEGPSHKRLLHDLLVSSPTPFIFNEVCSVD